MLRRTPTEPQPEPADPRSLDDRSTRVDGRASVRGAGTGRSPMRERLTAAGIHLLLSAIVGACVAGVALLAWYPSPLPALLGVDAILLLVLAVDVILGPVFTLIVFDRGKRRLAWDLAAIATLQVAALGYGLHTLYQGRPAFVVLVRDRFEVVSPAELGPEARAAALGNPDAAIDPLRPRWVAARMPEAGPDRDLILLESVMHGRDVQHHPRLYIDLSTETAAALERALPIDRLRTLNPQRTEAVDAAIRATGRDASALRYLPLRGPAADGAVLVGHPDGRILGAVALDPW
jgi:hypothetical protein